MVVADGQPCLAAEIALEKEIILLINIIQAVAYQYSVHSYRI